MASGGLIRETKGITRHKRITLSHPSFKASLLSLTWRYEPHLTSPARRPSATLALCVPKDANLSWAGALGLSSGREAGRGGTGLEGRVNADLGKGQKRRI